MNSKTRYFLLAWSQIGWFGCVYAAKFDVHLVSLLFPLIAWAVLLYSKTLSNANITVLLGLAVLGTVFDGVMANLEWIQLNPNSSFVGVAGVPVWLISMWLLFVTILPFLANLFKDRNVIALVAGLVAGPLTYKSGEAFDVLYLANLNVFIVYAIFWGAYFVSGLYLVRKSYAN